MMDINSILNGKAKKAKKENKSILGSSMKGFNLNGFMNSNKSLSPGNILGSNNIKTKPKDYGIGFKGVGNILGDVKKKNTGVSPTKVSFMLNKKPNNKLGFSSRDILGDRKSKGMVSSDLIGAFRNPAKQSVTVMGDKITHNQKKVLKSKSIIGKFGDWDNDGVINGLDCEPMNPMKHGFVDKLKSFGSKFRKSDDANDKAESNFNDYLRKSADNIRDDDEDVSISKLGRAEAAKKRASNKLVDSKMSFDEAIENTDNINPRKDPKAYREYKEYEQIQDNLESMSESERLDRGLDTFAKQINKAKEKKQEYANKLYDPEMKKRAYTEYLNKAASVGIAKKITASEDIREQMSTGGFGTVTQEYNSKVESKPYVDKKPVRWDNKEFSKIKNKFEDQGKAKLNEQNKIKFNKLEVKANTKSFSEKIKGGMIGLRTKVGSAKAGISTVKNKIKSTFGKTEDEIEKEIELNEEKLKKELANSKTNEQRARANTKLLQAKEQGKINLARIKDDKDKPYQLKQYQKYASYLTKARIADTLDANNVKDASWLSASTLFRLAKEGKEAYDKKQKAKKIVSGFQDLKFAQNKASLRATQKLSGIEQERLYKYQQLLVNQTEANQEQLVMQRREAKARDLQIQRARQIQQLQKRQSNRRAFQQANSRAFQTEPGEGISVFMMDGIPNPEQVTQKRLKFL